MELGDAATADEVILAFLMAESDADRYGATIRQLLGNRGLTDSLILLPDLTSDRENHLRAEILAQYRGWGTDDFLFKGFPTVIEWHRARLSPNDAREMLYANSPEWVALSGGSRRIGDGASAAARTPAVSDPTGTVWRINAVADLYRQGLAIQPPIVVTTPIRQPLIAVEGHTRLTAWLLAERPPSLDVLLGVSDQLGSWYWR